MEEGEDPEVARRQAALAFGSMASHQERVRDRRLGASLEQVGRDVAYAARLLRKSPGFAVAAVATLALGIGATTAIFSAVDAVLLRPQPYPEPERLVNVFERVPNGGRNSVSGSSFIDWRDHQTRFESLVIYEVLLKLEALRQKRSMAEIVREAVAAYVTREPRRIQGAGEFASGLHDTAERAETVH